MAGFFIFFLLLAFGNGFLVQQAFGVKITGFQNLIDALFEFFKIIYLSILCNYL